MTYEEIIGKLDSMLYKSKHLHWGVDREIMVKHWEKDGKSREYIKVRCYSLMGNWKGDYECGYWDNVAGCYVPPRKRSRGYDIVEDDIV